MGFGETLGQFVLDTVDPSRLLEILNFLNLSIKFTTKTNDKELPFLDILIKRNDDKIWTDIYFKPRDTHRCLPFSLNHLNHCNKT